MATEKVSAKKENTIDLTAVSGKKFGSFTDLAAAVGIKAKQKAEKARKCKVCGEDMRKVAGNVWVCDNPMTLQDKMLKGQPVQVFGPCGNRVIGNPYA